MEIPTVIETGFVEKEIIKLLHKNKLYQGVRIRLSVFRDQGGKYTPQSNNASYIVETEYLEKDHYELNHKGSIIGIFPEIKKAINDLSNLKSANALLFVMAGIYAKQNKLDDCILLNEAGNIVEGISSNIFLIKGNVISTPPLKDGPVAGIMRKQILKIADLNGLKINFESSLNEAHLLNADEIFFTNSISGIQWVIAYKDRRYFNHIARQFIDKLNILAFKNS